MKTNYYFKCTKCKKEISEFVEYANISQFTLDNTCDCGGKLKLSMGCGLVIFKGKGYTKKRA